MSYFLNEEDSKKLARLLARAAVDPVFRQRALADPRGAVKEITGIDLPPNFRLRFQEQPAEYDAYVVLPPPVSVGHELTDAELEAVAGGLDDLALESGTCWDTCDKTCEKSCSKTCSVTDITVVPVE
jgi:hypothetical protein